MISLYKTITGRKLDVTALSSKERQLLGTLVDEYATRPDWSAFSRFWQLHLRRFLEKVPAKERPRQPLYQIAQDLEMRLGIAQGAVAEPDYRDYLVDRIEEKYGFRWASCRPTNLIHDQGRSFGVFHREASGVGCTAVRSQSLGASPRAGER